MIAPEPTAAPTRPLILGSTSRYRRELLTRLNLPFDTVAKTISNETQTALRRHWKRCGIRFPDPVALVMLHRASTLFHLVVTDHLGVRVRYRRRPRWGAASVLAYDCACLWDARRGFDLVYMLGYGAAWACWSASCPSRRLQPSPPRSTG